MSTTTPTTGARAIPLRWLILGTSAISLLAAALSVGLPAYRQWAVLRTIESLGGQVAFSPVGPDWLRDWIGEEALELIDQIEYVRFMPDEATFHARCSGICSGQHIFADGQSIDDSTLSCISAWSDIESLDLAHTNISDAGLRHISNLRNLKYLDLRGTDVSDASILLLATLQKLEDLDIADTQISKEKSSELRRALPACKVVDMGFWEELQSGPDLSDEEALEVLHEFGRKSGMGGMGGGMF